MLASVTKICSVKAVDLRLLSMERDFLAV